MLDSIDDLQRAILEQDKEINLIILARSAEDDFFLRRFIVTNVTAKHDIKPEANHIHWLTNY